MKLFTLLPRVCLGLLIMPLTASALLMRDNGPEPIIIQLKESLRKSDDLNQELINLALLEQQEGMTVEKRWVGEKYLELLSFPPSFTEEQALAVILKFQLWPSIEKVVAVSAFNLEFTSGDFAREFGPTELIPEAARRGLDNFSVANNLPPIPVMLEPPHLPVQFIVRWKDEYVYQGEQTGFAAKMAAFNAITGTTVSYDLYSSTHELTQVLTFNPALASLEDELKRYNDSPWVAYAQPDYLYSTQLAPNDPLYPQQWGLPKISAPAAWEPPNTQGTQGLVVAVGDTGANINHPDFVPNLSTGHRNFAANPPNSNVTDDDLNNHGSHVASIIGAKGNNGRYMTGVDWNVSLLILKVLGPQSGSSSTVAMGIDYAYAPPSGNPALAINLSLGNKTPVSSIDPAMRDAIRRAQPRNLVVVAAAGNHGVDAEQPGNLSNPAAVATDNVIAVGATDQNDARAGFSNYGRYRVELGAPGVSILGLKQDPNASPPYRFLNGTSQAAPHVTGALQLVKSKYPWENYAGLKDRVLMSVDDVAALNPPSRPSDRFRTGGRLNVNKALLKRNMIRNLSTRAKVGTGQNIVIGGFIINTDSANPNPYLKVAIRGRGPSLPPLGVPRLNNPKIRLQNSAGQQIFANNDWGTLPPDQKAALGGLTPTDSREAAIVQTLRAGAYTVYLESQDGQLGVGSFEIYELEGNNERTRLTNVSTRCLVGNDDEVAIAGTIVGDPAQVPKRRILSFGKGPSLERFGLTGLLPNPYLEFYNSSGGIIVANDQWRDIDGASTGLEDKLNEPKPGFAPREPNESAVWPTVPAGAYTAILKNSGTGTGLGLIEFFEY